MDGPPDKVLERIDALPHRNIDDDARVGIRPRVGGAAALVDIAPDESGLRSAMPFTKARLFVKSAIRGSSIRTGCGRCSIPQDDDWVAVARGPARS